MTATLEAIETQIRSGSLDRARQALDAAAEEEDRRADVQYLRGYMQEVSHDREAAIATYESVLADAPGHVSAAFRAALIYDQYGADDRAIELYERIASEPQCSINCLLNLAALYEEKGRLEKAEQILDAILEQDPNHDRARRFLKSVRSSYDMMFDEQSQRERDEQNALLDTPISDFELSVRSRNCLRQMNIHTLNDLLNTSEAELLSYKNFGETSLNEIKALLTAKNLRLGQALPSAGPPSLQPPPQVTPDAAAHLNRPVSELELSVRSRKALQRLGIMTIGELAMRTETELMTIKNFGQTSLFEIKRQLAEQGLSLRQPM